MHLNLGISRTGQSSHEIPTQLSYSAGRALWQAKMASVEFCIPYPQVAIGWHQLCVIDRKILKKPKRKNSSMTISVGRCIRHDIDFGCVWCLTQSGDGGYSTWQHAWIYSYGE